MPSGLICPCMWTSLFFILRVVGVHFLFYFYEFLFAKPVDPGSVASDLGLNCLPMSHL